jgi:pyruvate-formate lyase
MNQARIRELLQLLPLTSQRHRSSRRPAQCFAQAVVCVKFCQLVWVMAAG